MLIPISQKDHHLNQVSSLLPSTDLPSARDEPYSITISSRRSNHGGGGGGADDHGYEDEEVDEDGDEEQLKGGIFFLNKYIIRNQKLKHIIRGKRNNKRKTLKRSDNVCILTYKKNLTKKIIKIRDTKTISRRSRK